MPENDTTTTPSFISIQFLTAVLQALYQRSQGDEKGLLADTTISTSMTSCRGVLHDSSSTLVVRCTVFRLPDIIRRVIQPFQQRDSVGQPDITRDKKEMAMYGISITPEDPEEEHPGTSGLVAATALQNPLSRTILVAGPCTGVNDKITGQTTPQ